MEKLKEYYRSLAYLDSLIASRPVEFTQVLLETDRQTRSEILNQQHHKQLKVSDTIDIRGIKDCGGVIGIKRIAELLDKLGNPQDSLKIIHIAGTSGKGSTAFILHNILTKAGYKTGMHISPHLVSPLERIWINHKTIHYSEFVDLVHCIQDTIDSSIIQSKYGLVSYFEFLIALTFLYFHKQKVDFCILETGMGGTLDGTNIIKNSIASIITNIGFDHIDKLGHTQEEIARNKAGIIKQHSLVFTGDIEDHLFSIIAEKASNNHSDIFRLSKDFCFSLSAQYHTDKVFNFHSPWITLNQLKLSVQGKFQIVNATVALAALTYLHKQQIISLDTKTISEGLNTLNIPGRCETFSYNNHCVLLDGAHNLDKLTVLMNHLDSHYKGKHIIFIIGFTKRKDIDKMISMIAQRAHKVIITRPLISQRQIEDPLFIHSLFQEHKIAVPLEISTDPYAALMKTVKSSPQDTLICVTGSLYLVGNIRSLWVDEQYIMKNQTLSLQ